nr:unnamed protein product [Callosobruchus chinensis]CAH7768924.1 unnamed protein product [Callosobruchus chinensis]
MRMFVMKILMEMVVPTESHILSEKIRSPGGINTVPLEQQCVPKVKIW